MNKATFVTLIILGIILSGLGQVYSKHRSRELFQELETLRAHRDNLQMEWTQLQLEQSALASEAVVDYAARTRLDMVVPAPIDVVYVRR